MSTYNVKENAVLQFFSSVSELCGGCSGEPGSDKRLSSVPLSSLHYQKIEILQTIQAQLLTLYNQLVTNPDTEAINTW